MKEKKYIPILLGIFCVVVILFVGIVNAATFTDITQLDFDVGSYFNTEWSVDHIRLSSGQTSGVYTSRVFDAGDLANWSRIQWSENLPSADKIFTVDNDADVWKSIDNGATWTLVKDDYNSSEGNNVTDMIIDANGNLFILNNQDVWESTDSGVSWTKVKDNYNGSESNNGIRFASDNNGNLYIIEGDEDVWRSTDGGATWVKVAANMNGGNGNVSGLLIIPVSTDLVFSARSGDTNPPTGDFSGSFTDSAGSSLNISDARYFQYQATFNSGDEGVTPELYSAEIIYSLIDTTAPIITLAGEVEVTVETKTPYTDDGATASDDFDGDITANIAIVNPVDVDIVGDYIITYDVTDSGGNPADQVTRTVHVIDTTAPVITVPSDITEETTDDTGAIVNYVEPTAGDAVDGAVIVNCDNSSGDKFPVGITTITCTATDMANNSATELFTITVNLIQPTPTPTPTPPPSGGGGGGYVLPPPMLLIAEESINAPNISENSITLVWTTNFLSSSQVIYSAEGEPHFLDMTDSVGDSPKYGYAHTTPNYDNVQKVTSHSVTITGLDSARAYYFRTVSHGSLAVSGEYMIRTVPAVLGAATQEPAIEVSTTSATPVTEEPVAEKNIITAEETGQTLPSPEITPVSLPKADKEEAISEGIGLSAIASITGAVAGNIIDFIVANIIWIIIILLIFGAVVLGYWLIIKKRG